MPTLYFIVFFTFLMNGFEGLYVKKKHDNTQLNTKILPTYCTCYNLKAFIMFCKREKVRDRETIKVSVNSIRSTIQ
jgi:hypothetical protein